MKYYLDTRRKKVIKVSSALSALTDFFGFIDITPDEQPDFKPIISNHDNTSTPDEIQRIESEKATAIKETNQQQTNINNNANNPT